MNNLGKIRKLTSRDLRLLIQAVLLLPVLHLSLSILGYNRLHGVMKILIPSKHKVNLLSMPETVQRAQGIGWVVSVAARHGFYRATCLRRALLVWWFLGCEGIESRICFGVRRIDDQLDAHAWVEVQGRVVNDADNIRDTYQILETGIPDTKLGL